MLLFLKMASGHAFGPALAKSICHAIRVGLSAWHVPSLVLETKAIPVGPPPAGPGQRRPEPLTQGLIWELVLLYM